MSYSLRYDQDIDCILLAFENKVDISVIREAASQVARMYKETGCERLLNDMSSAIIDISFMEIFSGPDIMKKSGISRKIKRALVLPSNFSESRYFENVTRNRGHDIKVFLDVSDARAWLLKDKLSS